MSTKKLGVLAEMTEAFFNAGGQLLNLANQLDTTYKVAPRAYRATQKALKKRKEFFGDQKEIEEFEDFQKIDSIEDMFLDDDDSQIKPKTTDVDFEDLNNEEDEIEEY